MPRASASRWMETSRFSLSFTSGGTCGILGTSLFRFFGFAPFPENPVKKIFR
jgi:hypothetical protein